MNKKGFLIFIILVLSSGCAILSAKDGANASHAAGVSTASSTEARATIIRKLYLQHKEWKGVRYKEGGLSKRGIDCSGFVYMTFSSRFGLRLPRTTELLSRLGRRVDKADLRAGDLVFFKTRPFVRHVGIYLENGRFLHASKSKGVIISRLSNKYWKSRYWKAKRIERL